MKIETRTQGQATRGSDAGVAPRTARHFRSLVLGWTDPDSGERLTADVRGAEEWVGDLQELGFEVLGASPSLPLDPSQRTVSVVSHLSTPSRPPARGRRN